MRRLIRVQFLVAIALGVIGSSAYAVEPAGALTKAQVKALIQKARTPADHIKLAKYYRYEAGKLQARVKEHEEMGAAYDKNTIAHPIPKWPTLGEHCRDMVRNYSEAAKTANEMAALHEEMAKIAK